VANKAFRNVSRDGQSDRKAATAAKEIRAAAAKTKQPRSTQAVQRREKFRGRS